MQQPKEERLTTNAYCMSTVRLHPERMVMALIADSWDSACWIWMSRKAMVEALTTSYEMTADVKLMYAGCKLSKQKVHAAILGI